MENIIRRKKKIFVLIFLMFVTSVVLTVGTYAWFTGTATVTTSSFTVGIDTDDALEISIDGENWTSTTLTLNQSIIQTGYSGNKNKWPTSGLNPVSSNGVADTNGRLEIYRMGAITATPGGYRFIANKINNATNEGDGYLAFDLFIRNGKESAYNATFNADDNEAIYLSRESKVIATPAGASNPDYGLANSVRVAFMQVGRVNTSTTQVSTITGINCTTSGENTGLCEDITPTIWEPNNLLHNANLITYYNTVCKQRSGITTYNTGSAYACESVTNGIDNDTYVVKNAITSSSKTDIYDGNNGYSNANLNNVSTFTDSAKMIKNAYRDAFMYLAPNSITKIRVYIYLEGQDVDNYDLISNGNQIQINFGFTKDINSVETTTGSETPTLADYSWEEIKRISDELVGGTLTYAQMQTTYGISIGQTKAATINGETHKFRLIDTKHDINASGTTLGMTFEQVDTMNTTFAMKSTMSASDSWNISDLKTTINSWTIESELDAVITPAKKSCITSVASATITYVTSKLWIISEKEIANSVSKTYGSGAEGTAYKYYTDLTYSASSRLKRKKGQKAGYWLRSGNSGSSNFAIVDSAGALGTRASNNAFNVSICFSI